MKTHLSLHSLEISTCLCDLQNVPLCGRVWLSFFLTRCDRPLRCHSQIKHCHPLWKCFSVPPAHPLVHSSRGFPSPSYWIEVLIYTLRKVVRVCIPLQSVLVDILQFNWKESLKKHSGNLNFGVSPFCFLTCIEVFFFKYFGILI